jgi:hypothetical protein
MHQRLLLPALLLGLGLSLSGPARAAEPTTLPTVTTTGTADNSVGVDLFSPVGPYNQPEWTEHRRFANTRVYLQQEPWSIGFEQWWRVRTFDDAQPYHRFLEELEFGLPYHFQLDYYFNWAHDGGGTRFDETALELRWAFADWGKIWGNPTLYIEYAFVNHDFGGDTLESKVLFGDDINKQLQWGLNFVFESELSHELSKEVRISGGLSYVISELLSTGFEFQWGRETVAGERGNPEYAFEIGPSVQFRFSKRTHLDLVALFGCTNSGPRVESFVIFGIDLGNVGGGDNHYHPVSGMQH